jgi:hypothetical protein
MLARRGVVAAVTAVAALALAAPASAGTGHHLQRQRAKVAHRAAQLDAAAAKQAAQIAASRARLARLDAAANTALGRFQAAQAAAQRAQAASVAAQQALVAAAQQTAAARATLNQMAADAYRTMAAGGTMSTAVSLLQTGDPQSFLDGLNVLGQVGKSEGEAVAEFRTAQARQKLAQQQAAQAARQAAAKASAAAQAKQQADTLVAAQQQALSEQRTLLASTRTAASAAHATVASLDHQIAVARARAAAIRAAQARAAAAAAAAGTAVIPTCREADGSRYANGHLPPSALCPLWDAPGQMLVKPAAQAFDRMSKAYAAVFGVPLCVTSSYRSYAKQAYLYSTMPAGMAAPPGSSNHGRGLAVDLCGGIQVDGSPEHQWLLDHAAAFNWFHPAWALPGGAGPHEPWHWEYAG